MAEENLFVKKLIEARQHEVEQRRYVAAELAKGFTAYLGNTNGKMDSYRTTDVRAVLAPWSNLLRN
jgi:hypothetical protein